MSPVALGNGTLPRGPLHIPEGDDSCDPCLPPNCTLRCPRLLHEYSDNWVEQCSIREMGWFYLGYAAALRFFGNSPAIKLIEGGRKDELKPVPLKSEFKL
jgi:hypothetical protein